MNILKKLLKGGADIINSTPVASHYGYDTGFFALGLIGFIILLIIVIILALTMEVDGEPFYKKCCYPKKEIGSVWIGGCAGTRWGCCPDGLTTRLDQSGTNCVEQVLVGGCAQSQFGCCQDGIVAKIDESGRNCPENQRTGCAGSKYGCCKDGVSEKWNEAGSNCPTPFEPEK